MGWGIDRCLWLCSDTGPSPIPSPAPTIDSLPLHLSKLRLSLCANAVACYYLSMPEVVQVITVRPTPEQRRLLELASGQEVRSIANFVLAHAIARARELGITEESIREEQDGKE